MKSVRLRAPVIAVILVAALALVGAGSASRGAVADELAYERGGQIWLADSDGTNQRPVTRGYTPTWTSDGLHLAFVREVGRNAEIYSADADGGNLRRLTRSSSIDLSPAWSPDGTRIAFVSNRHGRYELYVMRADGTGARRVLPRARHGDAFSPSWSPDGRLIAFSSSEWTPENPEIYVVRPDGTGRRRLTRTKGSVDVLGDDGWPTWAPDGKRIAFSSNRTGDGEIWIMNANGSGQRRLAGLPRRDDWAPSFSGDGRSIAFHSLGANGKSRLYVVRRNGKGLHSLKLAGTDAAFRP
jgi:TolB protein